MSTTKRNLQRVASPHLVQVPFVVAGIGALAAIHGAWIDLTTGLVVFFASLAGSIVVSALAMNAYRCRDCRGRLKPPKGWWFRFPGTPLLFYCERCDVEWDTGLRGQED